MNRYAVVDAAGRVENLILWDGESEWAPPEGFTAQAVGDIRVSPGDSITKAGVVTPAPIPGLAPADAALLSADQVVQAQLDPAIPNPTQDALNHALAAIAEAAMQSLVT